MYKKRGINSKVRTRNKIRELINYYEKGKICGDYFNESENYVKDEMREKKFQNVVERGSKIQ